MLKIAITPPELTDERKEAEMIRAIIDDGSWDKVHLRHPQASRREMSRLIEAVPHEMHRRLVVHGHFDLINDFNLGGLHLNRRCPQPPALYNGSLSRSCHTINEVLTATDLAYVTLSPIFDSISKSGYNAAFTDGQLSQLADTTVPVIALGGVTPERIDHLRRHNFSGFAMLGSLPWTAEIGDMIRFVKTLSAI